jgi:hypothetical protein
MKIGNWKTRSVFLRYAGVNDENLAVAMNQCERHQTERKFAQPLHTDTKNENAQPARVGAN